MLLFTFLFCILLFVVILHKTDSSVEDFEIKIELKHRLERELLVLLIEHKQAYTTATRDAIQNKIAQVVAELKHINLLEK